MAATNAQDWWNGEDIISYFAAKDPNELLVRWLHDGVLPHPASVIDIGCGYGRNLTLFNDTIFAAGFDPSQGSISFLLRRSDLPRNALIKLGSLPNHPFTEERFDLTIADGVLHQITTESDWDQSLIAICKVVKSGGWLFLSLFVNDVHPGMYQSSDGHLWISTIHPPMRLYSSEEVMTRLLDAGATVVRSVLEQFMLQSGLRANLTLLLRFN